MTVAQPERTADDKPSPPDYATPLLGVASLVAGAADAFMTDPRPSSRTLVLSASGVRLLDAACPGAPDGSEVSARVALNQLSEQFIHIELVAPGCDEANKDIRIRSADVQGVRPAP